MVDKNQAPYTATCRSWNYLFLIKFNVQNFSFVIQDNWTNVLQLKVCYMRFIFIVLVHRQFSHDISVEFDQMALSSYRSEMPVLQSTKTLRN